MNLYNIITLSVIGGAICGLVAWLLFSISKICYYKFHEELERRHYGWLWRKESCWVGCHYSKECKRYCLNIIPCLTIWWTKEGGFPVDLKRM